MTRRSAPVLLAGALLLPAAVRGDEAPPWLKALAAAPLPAYDKKVPAVVLLEEGNVRIGDDGRVHRTMRYAVKVLTTEGARSAVLAVDYGTEARKVTDVAAWSISPNGDVRRYGKKDAIDVALSPEHVYVEARRLVLSAAGDTVPGSVFGGEYATEERPLFANDEWQFQQTNPVRESRYSVTLPAEWRVESRMFNHAGVAPTIRGQEHVWELRDLPFIADEPLGPPLSALAPRLGVRFLPPDGGRPPFEVMTSWTDVSRWYSQLSDPQGRPTDPIVAKARALTTGASDDVARVRALARYVQDLTYVSIQIGIGRYRPHAAGEVLVKGYGDCKDKANLLRALLAAVGIESHLVLVYSGDPFYVRDEWASASQFNHCILAVRLSTGPSLMSIVDEPGLGRILFFDATDPDTHLGDLPLPQQGSWGLVAAGDRGRLVRLPRSAPEGNVFDRQLEATLDAEGSLQATVRETSVGQASAEERTLFRAGAPEVKRRLDAWVTDSAATARLAAFEPRDDADSGRFTLTLDLTVRRYAQLMQQRLLVFRPVILNRREWVLPTATERTQPIWLEDATFSESARFVLPAGFAVDELPEAVKLETSFGTYESRVEAGDGFVRFERRLGTRRATIPAERYAEARDFFRRIRDAEQASIVLMRR